MDFGFSGKSSSPLISGVIFPVSDLKKGTARSKTITWKIMKETMTLNQNVGKLASKLDVTLTSDAVPNMW